MTEQCNFLRLVSVVKSIGMAWSEYVVIYLGCSKKYYLSSTYFYSFSCSKCHTLYILSTCILLSPKILWKFEIHHFFNTNNLKQKTYIPKIAQASIGGFASSFVWHDSETNFTPIVSLSERIFKISLFEQLLGRHIAQEGLVPVIRIPGDMASSKLFQII